MYHGFQKFNSSSHDCFSMSAGTWALCCALGMISSDRVCRWVQMAEREAGMMAAWAAGDDYRLPMGRVDDSLDTTGLQQASLDAAIPASNRGFQMLQRMGWSQGKGLGAAEDGAPALQRTE